MRTIIINGIKYYILYKEGQILYSRFYKPIFKMIAGQTDGWLTARDPRKKFAWDPNVAKYRSLSRRVAALQPEQKTSQYSYVDTILTGTIGYLPLFNYITQGTTDTTRLGDVVRIKSISIRGVATEIEGTAKPCDFYIIKLTNNDPTQVPLNGDFIQTLGGHLDTDDGIEIYHKTLHGSVWNGVINYKRTFKNGMKVTYNRNGDTETNKWFIVIKNGGTQSIVPDLSVQIRFTDS